MSKPNSLFRKKRNLPFYIGLATKAALATAISHHVYAQNDTSTADSEDKVVEEIVVTGMRASILSAQDIKRDASSIVDSVVAEDIGKLPDRSVTEAIQRIPGVTVSQFESLNDPEHFSAEGTGVAVRGLTQIRSELNGRDIFTASSGGRALSFEDVPAELMAGVDVIKSPTADMVEGGLGGIVNLRTRMPFDSDGQEFAATIEGSYGESIEEYLPSLSALYSNTFDTGIGEIGFLVDVAASETKTRTDGLYSRAWYERSNLGGLDTSYLPIGADWRRVDFSRDRLGTYAAVQWAPNEDVEVYATFFRSDYELRWDENAMFLGMSSRDVINLEEYSGAGENVDPLVFDSSGKFVSGSLTSGLGNGVTFGSDTRINTRESATNDFSVGVKWNVTEKLKLSADLQRIEAETDGIDNTISLNVEPRYVTLDYSGTRPTIYADQEWLDDPDNYSWSFTMPYITQNEADETAFRMDAEYLFDDSIFTSVKSGVRVTKKEAENTESDYHWRGVYQSWMRGPADWQQFKDGDTFPSVPNPDDLVTFEFSDFYRGDASVPGAVLVPDPMLVTDYPDGIFYVHEQHDLSTADVAPDMSDRLWQNNQEETTTAIYVSTDFAFDSLNVPLTGNLGVRVVKTENTAAGYIIFPAGDVTYTDPDTGESVTIPNPYNNDPIELPAENDYTNVLPNLNLKYELTDNMLLRFAAAKAISRPDFGQLKSYMNLSADQLNPPPVPNDPTNPANYRFTMSSDSNPYLEPMESTQFDLSWEWYFSDAGSTHVNLFTKDIEKYIRDSQGYFVQDGIEYEASWPLNAGTAKLNGVELGWNQFMDFLPEPFDGIGFQANYTYIDSSTDTPDVADPLDTDGTAYGAMPYEGISEHSYNLVAMYEKYGWSFRLAYNWRSEYLMSVGANGYNGYNEANGVSWRLPVYSDDYGQLDGSIGYDFNDHLGLTLSASNITNAETTTYMDQNAAGENPASYFVHDTRYDLSLRVKF